MNTQKIQNVKGFTLVELIVVITILVILGTIAFLNLGGMSASARDSQRTSDLNQINTQIMTKQAKDGLSYISMVTDAAGSLSGVSIAGATVASGATTIMGGNVNYTALGIDSAKFSDPVTRNPYKMGATPLAGTAYELAASLEETSKALVMGTFRSRAATTLVATVPVGTTFTVLAADIGKLKSGDTITLTTGTPATANVIKSISGDGLTVTLTTPITVAGTNPILADEVDGLVAQSGSTLTWVTNGGAALPY